MALVVCPFRIAWLILDCTRNMQMLMRLIMSMLTRTYALSYRDHDQDLDLTCKLTFTSMDTCFKFRIQLLLPVRVDTRACACAYNSAPVHSYFAVPPGNDRASNP